MSTPPKPPHAKIQPYHGPAGGWGALGSAERHLARQNVLISGNRTLLAMNQPEGFDCPGCAWPDPKHTSSFEYCENGAKAVAWEATAKRTGPDFFAAHSVTELLGWSDFALEDQGRLTHPMIYDAATDHYRSIAWEDAFARIGQELRALDHPDQAEFYTSGRASNEAAFLYQLFGRAFGTNNFPDCSNMCHESTSVGLTETIGIGKSTVTLEDFERADAFFIFGQNPGTNSPRMLTDLRAAAKRGVPIITFNPVRERGLERFVSPQSPVEMLTLQATPISSHYHQLRIGGDLAALAGIMKAVLAADDAAIAGNSPRVLDIAFIEQHTKGFDTLATELRALDWPEIERESGLTRATLEEAAAVYCRAQAVIVIWGMGITQHESGVGNVQQLVNLLLLRGNIGRPGAGPCPVRGHSNVQGDRTVGINEKPKPEFLDALQRVFNFTPPRHPGHAVTQAIEAMIAGDAKIFIALGGNFAAATPDTPRTMAALRGLRLTVQIATKLNRSHLVHGQAALLLPCLGRTEIDFQASGPQSVTVEDSMSNVHASGGLNMPASPALKSEIAIIAGIAKATLPPHPDLDWDGFVADYNRIRDKIEAVLPHQFQDYNQRIRQPGGFRIAAPVHDRLWQTSTGRANFTAGLGLIENQLPDDPEMLQLMTFRSHDQYNTTIYGWNDRYRGVFGQRLVVFINAKDRQKRGFAEGAKVDLTTICDDGILRRVTGFTLVDYDIPMGSCAAYYPETNPLVPLSRRAYKSNTPTSKSIPIRLSLADGG